MSLDVYLTKKDVQGQRSAGPRIYIREHGEQKEISRQEWDLRFPKREPVTLLGQERSSHVYHANITHNLGRMADHAGLYSYVWQPETSGIVYAYELIEHLTTGLAQLEADPEGFRQFNPSNGWGSYELLVTFIKSYLTACRENPDAEVSVSR